MKLKTICIALLSIVILYGCKAPEYTIGMSETDFLKHNRVETVEQTSTVSVYRKTNYPFGKPAITKFFYFQNGQLSEVNEGKRQPDVIIQNQH